MAKSSAGKKRKSDRPNKVATKAPKKSKRDETGNDCEKTKPEEICDSDINPQPEGTKSVNEETRSAKDLDIDDELDRNASKSNLSVFNVKSLIHHVLSDERVVAMACKAAENEQADEEKCKESGKPELPIPNVEPKLTRSKFREVAQSTGAADPLVLVKETIIQSPLKKVVSPLKSKHKSPDKAPSNFDVESSNTEDTGLKLPLVDIKFSDEAGSSDEEYDPLKEERDGSEEDSESCVSNTSDLASPEPLRRTLRAKRRLLSDQASSPQAELNNESNNEKSGQDKTIISPFKIPLPISKKAEEQKEKEKADLIASRTRSRLPLTDTSLETLEASFVPPDFSPDLYDVIKLEELDNEDIDWQKWLFGLNTEKGGATVDIEDPEDAEYNFMAEDEKEEREEYRNDRAVKVSQKELAELFEEFLKEFGDEIAETESKGAPPHAADTHDKTPTEEEELGMTLQQRECLIQQLQQHTQLLVQMILLSREHPSLHAETVASQAFLAELIQQSQAASNANASRLLENPNTPPSIFSFVGLAEAARIVNLPYVPSSKPVPKDGRLPLPPKSKLYDSGTAEKAHPIPQGLTKLLVSSPVFVYTGLLPHVGFSPDEPKTRAVKFLQCEDNLLVLGIAEHAFDWYQIWKNYLPTKTIKQIKIRRKNLCSARAPDNVVKQFKRTGQIPPLPLIATFTGEDRQRILLPANELLTTRPSWLKDMNKAPVGQTKINENEGKKKVGRKRRRQKTVGDTPKQEIPIVSYPRNVETVVRIKPKETPEITANTENATATTSLRGLCVSTSAADGNKNEIRIDHVEASFAKDPPENFTTVFLDVEDNQKNESSKITAEIKDNFLVGEKDKGIEEREEGRDEVNTTHEVSIICPDSKQHEVTEASGKGKEKVDLAEQKGVEEPIESSQTETHENKRIRERAILFAQVYLNNVKKCLENDSSTYQNFLEILLKSKCEQWSPTKLYKEIGVVLHKFPDLVRDFVGFLEPHEAVEAGVFMTNNEIIRARTFLQRVEDHFQKNPAHFQKIIKAFTTFDFKDPKATELYDTVFPLLKGQQNLIEEFNSFFSHLKPRISDSDEFEEIELGSASDIEVDEFEEVIIPDMAHNRNMKKNLNMKGKCPAKVFGNTAKPGNRKQPFCSSATRKVSKMKKSEPESKNEGSFKDDDKDSERIDNDDGMAEKDTDCANPSLEERGETSVPCGLSDGSYYKKILESDDEGSGYKMNSDGESKDGGPGCNYVEDMSPLRQYAASEASNDDSSAASEYKSPNPDDFLDDNIDSPGVSRADHMTSTSEGTSDISNEACDLPNPGSGSGNQDEYCEPEKESIYTPEEDVEMKGKDENIAEKPGRIIAQEQESNERDSTNLEQEVKEMVENEKLDRNDACQTTRVPCKQISANNLELGEDGKSVIVWTREDDKKILQVYQSRNMSANIYEEIAQELGDKTAAQVEGRFRILVQLLAESNDVNNSSGESETEGEEGSCEELDEQE